MGLVDGRVRGMGGGGGAYAAAQGRPGVPQTVLHTHTRPSRTTPYGRTTRLTDTDPPSLSSLSSHRKYKVRLSSRRLSRVPHALLQRAYVPNNSIIVFEDRNDRPSRYNFIKDIIIIIIINLSVIFFFVTPSRLVLSFDHDRIQQQVYPNARIPRRLR